MNPVDYRILEDKKMITDTEIKIPGNETLVKNLGIVEAERFVALIQREPFDYTEWKKSLER